MMAVRDITVAYANAQPPLAAPGAFVVFTDKRTGLVVGLSTDIEVQRGRVLEHWFSDYAVHEGVSLTAKPAIGKPWPLPA